MSTSTTSIILLRNDLRLHDNELFIMASKKSKNIIPIFCFDPRQVSVPYIYSLSTPPSPPSPLTPPTTFIGNFPKCGPFRSRFLVESINDLSRTLESRGCKMMVAAGYPEDIIPSLITYLQTTTTQTITSLFFQREFTSEEVSIERTLHSRLLPLGIPIQTIQSQTLLNLSKLPFTTIGECPDTFTAFRKHVEVKGIIEETVDSSSTSLPISHSLHSILLDYSHSHPLYFPAGPEKGYSHVPFPPPPTSLPDPRGIYTEGGESAGMKRAREYILERKEGGRLYKETRNGMVGREYSTKLSPYLSLGCVSPRLVYEYLKRLEEIDGDQKGSYWIYFELLWRDYFKLIALKYGSFLFHIDGIKGTRGNDGYLSNKWTSDATKVRALVEARTGVPFIDAGLRELLLSGFSSNRMRQNLASFIVHSLKLDWRIGACLFESYLTDYDVCSNYGNWQYLAGIGNDPRENRRFNVIKQAKDYDGNGMFVKTWCPELSKFEDGSIELFMPWKSTMKLKEWPLYPIVIEKEWNHHISRNSGNSNSNSNSGSGINSKSKTWNIKKFK